MRKCLNCDGFLKERFQLKYCSNKCQIEYQYKCYIHLWKSGKQNFGKGASTKNISKYLKRYLINKCGEKCSVCGWKKRHPATRGVPLEVDHIDGDSENNSENNLRIICPNCHSLTPNFKNRNKGKGRKWRKEEKLKMP